jgi:hypothetical protein
MRRQAKGFAVHNRDTLRGQQVLGEIRVVVDRLARRCLLAQ